MSMPGFFEQGRRPNLAGMHPTDERPTYWADVFAEYEDTPYLTGLVNVCTVLGTFVGVWTLIILLGDLHHGLAAYWPLILILAIDTAVNVLVRWLRAKRRAGRRSSALSRGPEGAA